MDNVAFAAVTRRLSLGSLGAVGLAAFASPVTASAKNKAKKKLKKKQQQRCQSQVEPCHVITTSFCEVNAEDPEELQECLDNYLPCCDHLATCDTGTYLNCID